MLKALNARSALRLLMHPRVQYWHKYISTEARTQVCPILLFVPCAKSKPYTGRTKSIFYRWLWSFLRQNEIREKMFICTVSEPFALFLETDYDKMPLYELSPKILKENETVLKKYEKIIAHTIAAFLKRNKKNHRVIFAYVRPDSTHRRFLSFANRLLGNDIIKFVLTAQDLENLKKSHRRTWQLNWMIFLENKLLNNISRI
jgi:predicted RNA-binding protein